MNRRNWIKGLGLLAVSSVVAKAEAETQNVSASAKEIYEWRIYALEGDGSRLDKFLEKVFIPAYNRRGVKAGVFRPIEKDDKRYVLLAYKSLTDYYRIRHEVMADKQFLSAAQPFYDATAPNPAYSNFETFLCESFDKFPKLVMPGKSRKVMELRIYHSPNEEANSRKVAMFNNDEINVFNQVGIKPVCFGNIMAGPQMPALMYLTWHESLEKRNATWDKFKTSAGWLGIKNLPKYAYTATITTKLLLYPMDYSQI